MLKNTRLKDLDTQSERELIETKNLVGMLEAAAAKPKDFIKRTFVKLSSPENG